MTGQQPKKVRKRGRRILRRLLVWTLILLLLAAAGFVGYQQLKQEYTVTYDGYTAVTGSISNSLSFSSSLGLIDSATYTAASSSTVRQVYVSVGDTVKEGDKLLRLANGETIEADFDGRVNQLDVDKGDSVSPGDSLIQVADFEHLRVSLRVDEYDIADVSVGQRCTVTTTATNQAFDATIDAISYISSSQGSVAYYTATVYVNVGDTENVYPGMQVTVTVPQEEAKDVVILKMDALSFSAANSAFVYKQLEDGTMEQVPVEVGVSNGNYVEIKSGIAAGETVYAVAEAEETTSALGGLLSGIFGGQQMNMPGGGPMSFGNGQMPDFGNGQMPDFGNSDGSSRPGRDRQNNDGFGGSGGMGGGQ